MISRKKYFKLLIILKTLLLLQGKVYLPQLLTGNIEKLNTRTIQNSKFTFKLDTSAVWQRIIEDKFDPIQQIKTINPKATMLSTLINSTFTLVDYSNKDRLGEVIEPNVDVLADEFMDFLNQL
jgi:hypothetical protein